MPLLIRTSASRHPASRTWPRLHPASSTQLQAATRGTSRVAQAPARRPRLYLASPPTPLESPRVHSSPLESSRVESKTLGSQPLPHDLHAFADDNTQRSSAYRHPSSLVSQPQHRLSTHVRARLGLSPKLHLHLVHAAQLRRPAKLPRFSSSLSPLSTEWTPLPSPSNQPAGVPTQTLTTVLQRRGDSSSVGSTTPRCPWVSTAPPFQRARHERHRGVSLHDCRTAAAKTIRPNPGLASPRLGQAHSTA